MEARIAGTGSYLPGRPVTNAELERRVQGFDQAKAGMPFAEWAVKVTGIKTRHFSETESAEAMAVKASRQALAAAGIRPDQVDFIIGGTFTPEKDIPNFACSVAEGLGHLKAGGIPVNAACAGFIYGLSLAYALIKADLYRNVLVVSAERLSRLTDFADPRTAVLFGDGAGAAVVQASTERKIFPPFLGSDFSPHIALDNADALAPYAKTFIQMPGGPHVLRRAVDSMERAGMEALKQVPCQLADVAYVIPHQANGRIVQALTERLGEQPERVAYTVEQFGNTSGATVPIALDKALRGELGVSLKPGDKVLLTAIGGGYTVGAMVVEL